MGFVNAPGAWWCLLVPRDLPQAVLARVGDDHVTAVLSDQHASLLLRELVRDAVAGVLMEDQGILRHHTFLTDGLHEYGLRDGVQPCSFLIQHRGWLSARHAVNPVVHLLLPRFTGFLELHECVVLVAQVRRQGQQVTFRDLHRRFGPALRFRIGRNATRSVNAGSVYFLWDWNIDSDPAKQSLFRDVRFRQAMAHLLDRDEIIHQSYGGAALPRYTAVSAAHGMWVNDHVPKYEYDPERALELLAELGYTERNSDGFLADASGAPLTWVLLAPTGWEFTASLIADSMREHGVEVLNRFVDFETLNYTISTESGSSFEAALISVSGPNRDWPFPASEFTQGGSLISYNRSGAAIAPQELQLEELYRRGRRTLDDAAARAIAMEIQQVEAELLPRVHLVSTMMNASWLTSVRGHYPERYWSSGLGTEALELLFKVP